MCDPRQKRAERRIPIRDKDERRWRSDFERDYTAILYSHAFRRLRHKTQVFFYSQNDHVCTRLDHSLYVAAIAEVVCKNLQKKGIECDPVLARTIGIGHDLGHAPFGHAGEEVLNELAKEIGGFRHEKHGLRIVDKIERPHGEPQTHPPVVGLNLTLAVRDGIANHCGEDRSTQITPSNSPPSDSDLYNKDLRPFTLEGCIVRLVDKVAYLGRDLEDAVIAGLIEETDIPGEIRGCIGTKNGEIVDYFVDDIISASSERKIALSDGAAKLMERLIRFNYDKIYTHNKIKSFKERVKDMLYALYERLLKTIDCYKDNIDLYMKDDLSVVRVFGKYIGDRTVLYFNEEKSKFDKENKLYKRIVIDFLSTLTDNFVFQACSEYFLPRPII